MEAFPCPCCGHVVFGEGPGSYEICPVCFWEDDPVQLRWPDYAGGANRPPLAEAQRTYVRTTVSEVRLLPYVRDARPDEPVDPGWRSVDSALDDFEPMGVSRAPWPKDLTVLYWWRPSFWRPAPPGRTGNDDRSG